MGVLAAYVVFFDKTVRCSLVISGWWWKSWLSTITEEIKTCLATSRWRYRSDFLTSPLLLLWNNEARRGLIYNQHWWKSQVPLQLSLVLPWQRYSGTLSQPHELRNQVDVYATHSAFTGWHRWDWGRRFFLWCFGLVEQLYSKEFLSP
jgi:hypothetical protein